MKEKLTIIEKFETLFEGLLLWIMFISIAFGMLGGVVWLWKIILS